MYSIKASEFGQTNYVFAEICPCPFVFWAVEFHFQVLIAVVAISVLLPVDLMICYSDAQYEATTWQQINVVLIHTIKKIFCQYRFGIWEVEPLTNVQLYSFL